MLPRQTFLLVVLVSVGYSNPLAQTSSQTPTCLNPTYTVIAGDDCATIAKAQSVSTLSLIALNGLNAQCTNLELGKTICIPPQCKTYEVKQGDTCAAIAQANGLDLSTFFSYNPSIANPSCGNLNFDTNVCVDKPQGSTPLSQISPSSPTGIAPTGTSRPLPGQSGISTACAKSDTAVPGDDCNVVATRNRITRAAFLSLNPTINAQCTNLIAGNQYCVQAARDRPIRTCAKSQRVREGDTCDALAKRNGITLATFYSLNPTIDANCSNLLLGQSYCVKKALNGTGQPRYPLPSGTGTANSGYPLPTGTATGKPVATNQPYLVRGPPY